MKKPIIKRSVNTPVQIKDEQGKRTIEGLIPYNSRSVDMGFFEYITPTAFNKTISDGADVLALMNHDSSKVLGRVKNKTLTLQSREDGLYCSCTLPDTSYGNDCYELIKNGYVPQMSFGFSEINTDIAIEEGKEVHYLKEVRLYEVSFCVSMPAYEETESQARSIRGIDVIQLSNILEKDNLQSEDYVKLQDYIESLNKLIPKQREVASKDVLITGAVENTTADNTEKFLNGLLNELREINKKG